MNRERLRKSPNLAIVGSTSLLGKELREMLEDRVVGIAVERYQIQRQGGEDARGDFEVKALGMAAVNYLLVAAPIGREARHR